MRCDGMSSQWSVISKHTHTQQIQVFGWKFQKRKKKKTTDVVESVLFWLVVTCYKMDLIFNFTIGNYVSTYFEKKPSTFLLKETFPSIFLNSIAVILLVPKTRFLNNDFKNVFLPFKKRQKFRRHDIFHISLPKLPQSFSQHYIVKNLIWHF